MAFQPSYGLITSLDELRELVTDCRGHRRAFSFDIETGYYGESREKASLHPEENFLVGISFTNSLKWARYVPLRHDTGSNLDSKAVAEIMFGWLVEDRDEEGQPFGVAWGGKFELRCMDWWFGEQLGERPGYQRFRIKSDGMLESYVEAMNRTHGLKECTEQNFGHKQLELEDLYPEKLTAKQKKSIRFNVLDPHDPKVVHYACEDSLWNLAHHRKRYPKLKNDFIYKMEMQVLPVVCAMEDEGIWYDWNGMREWGRKAHAFADLYMEEIREDFGKLRGSPLDPQFNFGSSQQLARLLYEDCGMPVRHWTKGGKSGIKRPGTDAKVALKGLSKEYAEVSKYLEWKKLTKLYRDFLEAFEGKYSFGADGRAHPSMLQHGVPGGRFAHADPNYAQSPKKYHYTLRTGEEFDFNFREMLGAPPGWYQLGFDLAQAELRAIAGLAQEEKMLKAFRDGVDVHSVTASLIFGVPVEQVTPDQRDVGKTMGLALVYGLTEDGLADRLGITRQEAEELFAAFHAAYPKIKEWTERTIQLAGETGYVETCFGRRVRIWDIDSSDRRKRKEAQRTAGNAPVQGSATGDYMKIAMIRADAALRKAGLIDDVRLVMNVHDALEWYVREHINPARVIAVLEPAVIFPVHGWPPMIAEWHAGRRWGSYKDLEVQPDGSVRVKVKKKAEPVIDLSEEEDDDVAPVRRLPGLDQIKAGGNHPDPGQAGLRMLADVGEVTFPYAEGPPRTVIIEPAGGSVPRESAPHLVRYCRARPGPNTLILKLREGEADKYLTMTGTTGVSPADEAEISVILGGASVHYDEASADLDAIGAGLEM